MKNSRTICFKLMVINILLLLTVLLSCSSTISINTDANFSGRITEHNYQNDFFGFEINLPDDFVFESSSTHLGKNPNTDGIILTIRQEDWLYSTDPQCIITIASKKMFGGARSINQFIEYVNAEYHAFIRNQIKLEENVSDEVLSDNIKMFTYKAQEFRQLAITDFGDRYVDTFSRQTPMGTEWLLVLQQEDYFFQINVNHLIAPESVLSDYLNQILSFINFSR